MKTNNCKKECKPGKFKRVRPFDGMLLTAEDFLLEQTYFREKIKLHNRLHGYGVVCGLEIKAKASSDSNDRSDPNVIVAPGMALDCNGNEIIVCEEHTVNLEEHIKDLFYKSSADCPQGGSGNNEKTLYIGIKYHEIPDDPEAVYASGCGCEEKRCEFSRVREGYCIEIFAQNMPWDPSEVCGDDIPICRTWEPQCPSFEEKEHYILLGTVTLIKYTQTVDESMLKDCRRYIPTLPPSYSWSMPENRLISKEHIDQMCEQAGWINIEFVIGMEVDPAADLLGQKGLDVDDIILLDPTYLRLIYRRAIDYLPFARPDYDVIHLIHDNSYIVLLPIVEPKPLETEAKIKSQIEATSKKVSKSKKNSEKK
jgi:hypothetical protein